MNTRPLLLVLATALLAAGCSGSPGPTATPTPSAPPTAAPSGSPEGGGPEGRLWQLESLDGAPVPPQPPITLTMSLGRATGSGGCNGYGGTYTLAGAGLRLGEIASTAMACVAPGIDAREAAYHRSLATVRSWKVTGGRLELADEGGAVRLRFVPAAGQ